MELDKPDESSVEKKYGWLSMLRDFVIFWILLSLLFHFILGISRVDGTSMEPTLQNGEVVFFNRLARQYETGDVVAAIVPSGKRYVKRIVAQGGDVIDLRDGILYVNDVEAESSFAQGSTMPKEDGVDFPYAVPENCFFLMGDNREHSRDSRNFGAIHRDMMIGKIFGH